LTLLRWDHRVAGYQFGEDPSIGFNTKGESGNIQYGNVLLQLVTSKDSTLYSSTVRYSFVRVDPLRGLFPEVITKKLLDFGYPR